MYVYVVHWCYSKKLKLTTCLFQADYDTFPIRKVHFDHLPADGKLAVYDQTLHGGE